MMQRSLLALAVACSSSLTAALQLVHPGATVALAEDGYQQVAALKSDTEMEVFVKRLLESKNLYAKNASELSGFVQWFSGNKAVQNFDQLSGEVAKKPWVVSMLAMEHQNEMNTTANSTAASEVAWAASAGMAPQELAVEHPAEAETPTLKDVAHPKKVTPVAKKAAVAKVTPAAKKEEESKKSAPFKKPTKTIGSKVENAVGSVWKSLFKHSGAAKEAEKVQQKKSEVEPTTEKTEFLLQTKQRLDASTESNLTVTENVTMESNKTEASSQTSETESKEKQASSETEASMVSMNDSLNVSLNASHKTAISSHNHKKFAHKKTGVATSLIATQARAHASMSTVKMADKMNVPAMTMTDLRVLTQDHRNQLFEAMGEDTKVVLEQDGGVAREKTIREVVVLMERKHVHPASTKEEKSKAVKGKHQKHDSKTSPTSKASKASKAGKHTASLSKKVNGKMAVGKTIANKTQYSCEHKCFKSTKAWVGVKCRWNSCAGCGQCTPDSMKGAGNETHMDMISYDDDDAEEETQSASPLDSVKSWFSKILGSKDSTDAKVTEEASAAAAGFPTRSRDDKKHQTLRHNTTAKLLSKQSLRDEAAKEYTLSDEKDYLGPANEKLSDLEQQIKELKGNLEDADKDARLAARDKKKEFESHLHLQESNITRLTNENKHIQGDIDKSTKTNTKLHKHALALQKDGVALKKQLLNLQEELSSADDFAADAQQVGTNVTDKVVVLRELEAREAVEQKVKQRKSAYKDVAGDELEDEETASLLQVGVDSLLDAESALVNLLDADKKPSHKHKKTHATVAAAETKAADAVAAAAAAAESFDLDGSSDTKAATLVDDMAIAFARLDSDMEMSLDELEEDFTNRSTAYTLQEEALEEKQAELLVEKKAVKVLHSRLQDTIKHLSDGIATLQEQVKSLRTFLSHVGKDTVADDSEKKDAKKAAAKTQHVSKPHAATHKAELIKKQAERSHEATEIITYAGEKETGKTTKHKPLSAKTAHKTHQK